MIGYYFESKIAAAKDRNALRLGKAKIPDAGIHSTYSKLERPSVYEGFDELYYVSIGNEGFIVKDWQNEV